MILGELDITRGDEAWLACDELITAAVKAALETCDQDTNGRACELSILLSDNDQVQELNREYREKDKPTNVLSFPALECEAPGELVLEPGPLHLGDIILAHGVVEVEAREQKITMEDHLTHLILHGVLHLLGYDHIEDEEAEVMESLEIALLKDFGIANPYASEAE
ncbi:Endoribonuclease YbeY [Candidatus Terasakiella magnetica]|uniref:Endoribonuclease YbeY n=1 Tax=Candidatus Terasakiella magnetica TaxID=1867952 RepID=A0A1C3RF40_9PROT|nr:rRNA maturation RNase YbeY [Candidatus Terasakiella magnetica]SCA55871.1 Endoribonuclease YbeY [Candidatus Terasakiella magnetica]